MIKRLALWLALPLGLLPATFVAAQSKKDITIKGLVIDGDGDPLPNARILIIPEGRGKPIPLKTDKSGAYSTKLPVGKAFDIIYQHSDGGMASVKQLSASHDQDINKILFSDQQLGKMSARDVYAEVDTYQYVTFLSMENSDWTYLLRERLDFKAVAFHSKKLEDRIKSLDAPKAVINRLTGSLKSTQAFYGKP